jgi:hypothetical protein
VKPEVRPEPCFAPKSSLVCEVVFSISQLASLLHGMFYLLICAIFPPHSVYLFSDQNCPHGQMCLILSPTTGSALSDLVTNHVPLKLKTAFFASYFYLYNVLFEPAMKTWSTNEQRTCHGCHLFVK